MLACLALSSCLLAVACGGRERADERPFARISPQHPMASATVVRHLFKGGGNMCAAKDFRAMARISEPECLARIAIARPACEQAALARMPAAISNKVDLRRFGIEYYRCLMPK